MRRAVFALAASLAGAGSVRAQPADWGARRAPFDVDVARRYQAILAKDPWDAGALDQLRAMYVRYKSLAALEATYANASDAASLIVLARLAPADLGRWQRVVAVAEDARSLGALADLERGLGHPDVALTHYERAIAAGLPKAMQRDVLRRMISIIEPNNRVDPIEKLYAKLVELDPQDARAWTERGISLLKLGLPDKAAAAFGTAIDLLRTDPSAQLDAIVLQARAFQLAAKNKAAQVAYERVLTQSPRGYYLQAEALDALIAIHASEGTLDELLTQVEKRYPPAQRGHMEWSYIAEIDARLGDYDGQLVALRNAVAAAPIEIQTQHKLVRLLDDLGKADEALAQLDRAARAAPGDQQLQIELAVRYRDHKDTPKGVATLLRLSHLAHNDARTHRDLADLFRKWNRPGLALAELEEIARIERDPEDLIALGEAYWTAGNEAKALAAWKRMGTSVDGLAKLADLYAEHEFFTEAIKTYTQAIAKAPTNADLWRARSELYELRADWDDALRDAEKAVDLVHGKTLDAGHTARSHLVRLLVHWSEHDDSDLGRLATAVDTWTRNFAQKPPDIDAGYMLAEYQGHEPSEDLMAVLDALHAVRPDDHEVTRSLARTYKVLHRYDDAIEALGSLVTADPAHAKEYAEQIGDLKGRLARGAVDGHWHREDIEDPELTWAYRRHDPIAPMHVGARMGVGTALRGPSDHSIVVGAYTELRIASHLAFVARLDWAERTADMSSSIHAMALATGVAIPILEFKDAVITLGLAHRTELRFGHHMGWDRLGLAGDATLEVIPKNFRALFDIRFEQGVSDHAQSSALLVELGGRL